MYEISPQHEFLIGVDSDGCVFDSMELKHKECFIPEIIRLYHLQAVSKYARETAEFINLYSRHRGLNRFPGLVLTLEMLRQRPEVLARGLKIEVPKVLAEWCRTESRLGNPALTARIKETGNAELQAALDWSIAVNNSIDAMVHAVPPFPFVRECLEQMKSRADILVCSATPNAALEKEWDEHDIAKYVVKICGQEIGSKKEILANAKKYGPQKTLMIGDAPGDYQAAKANACLFYPINPGAEDSSWERLYAEGLPRFFAGNFAGKFQDQILTEFEALLPEKPKWRTV
jgi:phosphoglycolate phosphatase-like HAD superfamily hydrolase